MIQAELFTVGDQVRTDDSDDLLVIREIEIRRGTTWYRVEGLAVGTWWVTHDELQPGD